MRFTLEGAEFSYTVGLCLSFLHIQLRLRVVWGTSGLSFPICEMGHRMAPPCGAGGILGLSGGGPCVCLMVLQPSRPPFLCFSPSLSPSLYLPFPQASHISAWNPLRPPGPLHHEDTVRGHRVLVPTVPGLEHCLFVPTALSSWPAGRLTPAGPAGPRD